ncbi:hypothetical protein [Alterisphingorhabdus coralli]|uniref:Phytoene synthase n=1 Tax=Alterisphingorhabdus coralli TaxID=3071408 RepID=A0AA97F6B8_9SPHN|nr:hypothetical protein [Parasphingorhabdus sp. SCSIO 66989]WOE74077.1 hypothetical protein RB602_09430 [Parasphingorhabdus sp. SCSIO 66989]
MDDPLHLAPWQRLALAYAPASVRKAQETVLAMDAIGGKICDSTSEMLLGQMRYAWWRDVINGTSKDRRTGHPLLLMLNEQPGFPKLILVPIIDAWEGYIADSEGEEAGVHAEQRGTMLGRALAEVSEIAPFAELEQLMGCYALWDDLRMGRYDDAAAVTAKEALISQITPLAKVKLERKLRLVAIIRDMIIRDGLYDAWDKPLMRPSMAVRIIRRGLTG